MIIIIGFISVTISNKKLTLCVSIECFLTFSNNSCSVASVMVCEHWGINIKNGYDLPNITATKDARNENYVQIWTYCDDNL